METRTESTIGSTGWQGNPEDGDGGDDHNVDVDDDREGQQQGEEDDEVMMTQILMTVRFVMTIMNTTITVMILMMLVGPSQ